MLEGARRLHAFGRYGLASSPTNVRGRLDISWVAATKSSSANQESRSRTGPAIIFAYCTCNENAVGLWVVGMRFADRLWQQIQKETNMLRVTQANGDPGITLKLEGKLVEPWVSEVRQLLDDAEQSVHHRLDLASVSYVDGAGVELLRELVDRGVEIVASSLYVTELLRSRRERDKS